MAHISVNLPEDLYQQLQIRAQELAPEMDGLKLSDTIRILLRSALGDKTTDKKTKVKNKQFQYIAAIYYLLNDYILSLEEKGIKINKKAHEKAEKIAADLLN
jgi:metal-responsive CopG/Arc/MetJ family transcriptional regulator